MNNNIQLLYIDLFCGAGGTSSGIELAQYNGNKCASVIACVNHDPKAIASHAANHPLCAHYTEDIRTLNLNTAPGMIGGTVCKPLSSVILDARMKNPSAYTVLWASLECTNFSKAKGGQPRDADSRTLAEHLFRYIDAINPDYIQIENVEEFMCWGDLDENGKPVSRDKGISYIKWIKKVCSCGYVYDSRILNAADFGAYTSRKRLFLLFAKNGLPLAFPVQTHAKNGDEGGMFTQYKKWKPVRDVLDLNDEGDSIFTRSKPLCEKTLERIYAGLVKFVAGGKKQHNAWILKYNSMNKDKHHNAPSIDEPCPTVATQNRLGLVKLQFLSKQFGGNPAGKNISLEEPAGTVTCKDHHAFVTAYYGNGFNSSIDNPAPTVVTKDRLSLVTTKFLDNQYGRSKPSSIEAPSPTLLNNPKQKLVSAQYLMNPYSFKSDGGSIDKPCFTLIARMDKMPPYLITTKEGTVGIAIYETDSEWTRKIKEFMAMYGIVDICMRMLKIDELKRIMGFPTEYVLIGTQAEQKKYIGNAVEVNMSRVLCEALCERLKLKKQIV